MKIHITKYILLLVMGISITTAGLAQNRHEVSIVGGGGFSTLKFNTDLGNSKNNWGGVLGFGYSYYFSNNVGFTTGAEVSLYRSKLDASEFNSTEFNIRDNDNHLLNYNSKVTNYTEEQSAMFLNIPLMLTYQSDGNNRFYLSAGAKLGIPLSGNYKGKGATFVNTGYIVDLGNTVTSPLHMGYGTFNNHNIDKSIEYNVAVMASIEAGMKWKMGNSALYTGVYLDYGLNDIVKDDRNQSFIEYKKADPENFSHNSLMSSSYIYNNKPKTITDKVIPMAIGLKLRFAFGKGKIENTPQYVQTVPTVVQDNNGLDAEARRKLDEAERKRLAAEAEMNRKIEKQDSEIQRLTEAQRKAEEMKKVKQEIEKPIFDYTVSGTTLSDDKKADLDKKIELLKKYPNLRVACEGYTCDLGSTHANEDIGAKRAEAVRDYMIEKGISGTRITSVSKDKSKPIAPNTNEENRKKNRRVEFIVID